MLVAGLAFLVGAVMTSCAGLLNNRGMASPSSPLGSAALVTLVLGRVSLGVGVGFANQAVPLFLNEISPAHLRGAFNIMFQLATTIGIILAQLVNVRKFWSCFLFRGPCRLGRRRRAFRRRRRPLLCRGRGSGTRSGRGGRGIGGRG